ncbi:LytR/AlgR family response regulator transcription factor [Elizabethkingia anophelis]|uniref:DNA-binding response regulator n=1 Tax=Elizabethkingia anophelis TaxID=1117645 RepID=A0AAU8UPY3_9FLAO|nr:LytTR family DNA-binding domain-containing protein [Elizabethkingia anophelis]AQX00323.1 DNA-binding response regulator [Elizabethkingia anophelis]MCT3728482.1 response regulator transcription factor [Elizabethkingia anophelis]MCT3789294.1 response regulator transcription factor [Elizabethkingia anophelis]MCT4122534.1 response regulator transcription factor [Elizabethkingia anophelis]MCT4205139.1 response regulator transcription factor [Elizabethkingia anophelis]
MSKILKCIIIDDEEGAHLVLRHYIKDLKQLQLKDSFYNPVEAMDYMYANPVDLVFLDINMPGMSGLQMLKALRNPPLVILTTAYKEYALESYEYRVVDYLVKPFDLARFMAAIENVFSRLPQNETAKTLESDLFLQEPFIILKVDGHVIKVSYNEITHIQSWGNYVKVFTAKGHYLSLTTTTETEQKLDKKLFMRIHKSYIIALKRISKISGGQVELDTGLILPVGNTYRRALLEYFQ